MPNPWSFAIYLSKMFQLVMICGSQNHKIMRIFDENTKPNKSDQFDVNFHNI